MRKYELANALARYYGFSSYLEICTPTTGFTYSLIDKQQFTRRVRVMYHCPPDFSDGEPIDYVTPTEFTEELYGDLIRTDEKFDLVFVDPWHTYASSLRDLRYGLHLVKETGIVLVHDCNPPDQTYAAPEFHPGNWCGVTYAAFLDVVLFTEDLHYTTVDTDYGCGMIRKSFSTAPLFGSGLDSELISQWQVLDLSGKYPFFEQHRLPLLRLISVDEFRQHIA